MGKHSHDISWKKYKEILDFDGYYLILFYKLLKIMFIYLFIFIINSFYFDNNK